MRRKELLLTVLFNWALLPIFSQENTVSVRGDVSNSIDSVSYTYNKNYTLDSTINTKFRFETIVYLKYSYEPDFYEFHLTLLSTNENDQIIERTDTLSGEIRPHESWSVVTLEFVKEYKIVGVKVTPITNNVNTLTAILSRVSDSTEVLNRTINISSTVKIMYDFETGFETISSD